MEGNPTSGLCPDCFQPCDNCLYSLNPDEAACDQCLEVQLQHLKHAHHIVQAELQDHDEWGQGSLDALNFSTIQVPPLPPTEFNYLVPKVNFLESWEVLQLRLTTSQSTASDVQSSGVRRRQWTDAENRDFEEWMYVYHRNFFLAILPYILVLNKLLKRLKTYSSRYPKPTKQQKTQFAESQTSLSVKQLDNKISNWKHGKNIQNQTPQPPGEGYRPPNELQSQIAVWDQPSENEAQIRPETPEHWTQRGKEDSLHSINPLNFQIPSQDRDVYESMKPPSLREELNNLAEQQPRLIPTATSHRLDDSEALGEMFDFEVASRPQSPVPSIERFLNSPELSASVDSIKIALDQGLAPFAEGPLESGSSDGHRRRRSFGDLPL